MPHATCLPWAILACEGAESDATPTALHACMSCTCNFAEQNPPAWQGSPEGSEALYWAHSIPQPETGCLLIAHPLMFTTSQQYFSQVESLPLPSFDS